MAKTRAEQEYQAKKKDVEIGLTRIAVALRAHAKRQSHEKANWGYVGDLGHVIEMLAETNRFLRGEKEAA